MLTFYTFCKFCSVSCKSLKWLTHWFWFCVLILVCAGDNVSLVHVKTAFSMIGKFGITGAFSIVYLYTPEIFPTNLRSRWLPLLWAYLDCLLRFRSSFPLVSFKGSDIAEGPLVRAQCIFPWGRVVCFVAGLEKTRFLEKNIGFRF